MRCLVTGANGHLGNNLTRSLVDSNMKVRAGVRNPRNLTALENLNCEIVHADLFDKKSLSGAMKDVDVLFQCAAVFKHWAKNVKTEIIEANLLSTRNVIEVASEQKIKKIIYVSSIAALDHSSVPLKESTWNSDRSNPYYRSKSESEKLAWRLSEKNSLWMNSVLPSAIIGPNCFGKLTPTMATLEKIINNEMPFDPMFSFNFVDVADVTKAMIKVMEQDKSGERYLLASENYTSSTEVFDIARKHFPKTKKPLKVSKAILCLIASTTGTISKVTKKEPPILKSWINFFYKADLRCDISRAREDLNFTPRPQEEALIEAIHYVVDRRTISQLKTKRR